LKPIVRLYEHICRSNKEIIDYAKTQHTFNEDTVILTADVKSLYPSIPIELGIAQVMSILYRHASDFEWTAQFLAFIHDLMQ